MNKQKKLQFYNRMFYTGIGHSNVVNGYFRLGDRWIYHRCMAVSTKYTALDFLYLN